MVVLAPVAGVERCVALPVAPVAAGGMGNAPLQACQVRVSNDAQDAPATPPGGGSPVSAAAAWMPAARSRLVGAFDAVLWRGYGEATDGGCPGRSRSRREEASEEAAWRGWTRGEGGGLACSAAAPTQHIMHWTAQAQALRGLTSHHSLRSRHSFTHARSPAHRTALPPAVGHPWILFASSGRCSFCISPFILRLPLPSGPRAIFGIFFPTVFCP